MVWPHLSVGGCGEVPATAAVQHCVRGTRNLRSIEEDMDFLNGALKGLIVKSNFHFNPLPAQYCDQLGMALSSRLSSHLRRVGINWRSLLSRPAPSSANHQVI